MPCAVAEERTSTYSELTQQLVQNDALRNRSAPFAPSRGALVVPDLGGSLCIIPGMNIA